MIFHVFNSYQKGFTKQYRGKDTVNILNGLNHRVMLG